MLMKNTQRQPGPSVSRPLTITPTEADEPPTAPKMPSARLRSRPSLNVTARIDRADGATSAAPNPCTARAAMSTSADGATPASSDEAENTARPARKTRRRPSMSPSRPPSRRNPPSSRP